MRSFANQFIDTVEDSVIEMGYVIAYTIDDFYLAQRAVNDSNRDPIRTVEILPNRELEEERIIFEAGQDSIISDVQMILAEHQLIYDRDLGQIVGMPEQDYVTPRPQRRKLQVIFRSKQQPPWRMPSGEYAKTVEINIPDVKQGLTWQQLKSVIRHFTWGKHRVTAYLDNGRQMRVHAVSYGEGERQIRDLIALSTANIQRISHGTIATDHPDSSKRVIPQTVYPAYAKLVIGDVTIDGRLRSKTKQTVRVNLWTNIEPNPPVDLS